MKQHYTMHMKIRHERRYNVSIQNRYYQPIRISSLYRGKFMPETYIYDLIDTQGCMVVVKMLYIIANIWKTDTPTMLPDF